MLIDTDVLIWYMRGNQNAYTFIENQQGFSVSVVTYIEIVQGMRNKNELNQLRRAFRQWNTRIFYIDEEISVKAMFLIERYFLSHSLQLADSLISSTCLVKGLPLATGNAKHFAMIQHLEIIPFHP
ncbi:type II toxin-antitoxin system VapC family toxin [candidate division KSB1 bacterium]|nr:type II toxin-antitoxin system VapC family toxin [candidate division KSB1 bacterium]